jgi:hypothetical protein
VPPGTALATDPATGSRAWIGSALGTVVEGFAWLSEVLQVMSGNRDEQRGSSPAAGNGS